MKPEQVETESGTAVAAVTVDARGLSCPLPVIRAKRGLSTVDAGAVVHVLATDPGSVADFTAWTKSTGHELVAVRQDADLFEFWIRRTR